MAAKAVNEQTRLVLVNAIHSKTGGGRVYLEEVLPRVVNRDPEVRYLVAARRDQASSLCRLGVPFLSVRAPHSSAAAFLWGQLAIPALAWWAGAGVVFTPANFGPLLLGRRSLLLLGNVFEAAEFLEGARAWLYWRTLEWATRLSVRAAKGGLIVSESFRSALSVRFGMPADRFEVVHHGCSSLFGTRAQPGEEHSVPPRPYLLVVADVYPHKNLLRTLDAFVLVRSSFPDLSLVLVGAEVETAYAGRVRRKAAEIGPSVRWLGPRPRSELPPLYRNASAVLCLSMAESFGITQVEAMASGACLVCSDLPVMREVSGDAALFVPPDDVQAIAATIRRLLVSPDSARELSRRSVLRAAEFSWDRAAERLHAEVRRRLGLPPRL